MKKVLSIVLSLVMVIGLMPAMAFADTTYSDVSGEPCEDAVTTLTNLGVINGYEDGTYQPDGIVTRAEVSKLIVSALGLADQAAGSTSSFTDLQNAQWAQGYIGYAESLGILEGDGDGTFRPSDQVTYNEFAAAVVRALGYTEESLQGSWPANYMTRATTLGIMDDITGAGGSNGATRGDCAIMMFNALTLSIGTVNSEGDWSATIISTDTTGDGEVYNIYDTMMRRLGAVSDEPGVVTLTDARNAEIDLYPYIGAYATLVYDRSDSDMSDPIAISEVESTFLTGSFNSDITTGAALGTDGTIEFEAEDGTTYTLRGDALTDTVTGIVNLTEENGTVTAGTDCTVAVETSGRYITKLYSVMTEEVEGEFLWASSDTSNLNRSTPRIKNTNFVLNDDLEIDTNAFVLEGVDSLDDITEDAVVTYYAADNSVVKVQVSTETVTGTISRVSSDGDSVTIDGTVYDISGNAASIPELGDEGTFYLNYNGEIYDQDTTSDVNYAVVTLAMGKDSGSYGSSNYNKVELLTEDGSQTIFTLSSSESNEKDNAAAESGNQVSEFTVGALVTYTLNSSNDISNISIIGNLEDGSNLVPTDGGRYLSSGYIDGVEIADDVMVVLPDDDDEYVTGSLSDIPVNEDLNNTYYYVYRDQVRVIFCDDAAENVVYGVVDELATVRNDDDETVTEVTLVDGTTYLMTEEDNSLSTDVLYAFRLSGDEISDYAQVNNGTSEFDEDVTWALVEGDVLGVNASRSTISATGTNGYTLVNEDAAIYRKVLKSDGTLDYMEVIELGDIAVDDHVVLYDINSDDSDGYDYIIVTEADDYVTE